VAQIYCAQISQGLAIRDMFDLTFNGPSVMTVKRAAERLYEIMAAEGYVPNDNYPY
jgi:hypothetical protein